MGEDSAGPPSTERVSVPQAADHLGTTVDAIRKRVQRGTIEHERDRGGRVWILLDTGQPRQDTAQDTDKPPSDSTALISEMRGLIEDLQAQLEAKRQAHSEARTLLLRALEQIPPAIEPPRETRESPESEAGLGPSEEGPTPTGERLRRPHKAPTRTLCARKGTRQRGARGGGASSGGEGRMPNKRIDNLDDHTVKGIWEESRAGGLAGGNPVEDRIVRSASVLGEKGYWNWMFTRATEDGSVWQDLRGNYWEVDPESGDIREWSA